MTPLAGSQTPTTYERTYGQMYGIYPHSKGLCPLPGRCQKSDEPCFCLHISALTEADMDERNQNRNLANKYKLPLSLVNTDLVLALNECMHVKVDVWAPD